MCAPSMLRPSKSVLLPALLAAVLAAAAVVAFVTPGLLVHSHHDAAPTGGPAPTTTTSTTTSLGGVAPMAPGWLKLENTKAGATDWRLTRPAHNGEIEGYASAISVQRGDVMRLFVSTTAPTFTVRGVSAIVGHEPAVFSAFAEAWREAGLPE